MKVHWNKLERRWQATNQNENMLFKKAMFLVHQILIEKGERPECENTGSLGFFEGEFADLPSVLDVTHLDLVRWNGLVFIDSEHEIVTELRVVLLLPNGQAVKLQ